MNGTMVVNNKGRRYHRYRGKVYGPDRIALAGFSDSAQIIARPAEANAPWLYDRSQRLHELVGGCTNMTDGLRKSLDVFNYIPKGVLKRIYLLSDGEANREVDGLADQVRLARENYVNINTIGFGDSYDEATLRSIAGGTHNGRFIPVNSLRELSRALLLNSNGGGKGRAHRSETSVLAIDLSSSMNGPMEGSTKIKIVEEAIFHLLVAKRQMYS